ncbi:membrane protein insertion efficiency factor YidD [Streptomyces sp. BE303]|uniref:membrane protein insertion efficiency factor YidD n=1 Tax=Streptomyces sp. BE303 TaxID=3002528 RepID=UPI002E7697DB|nr:membrane protein insertion efficiency factor YidD [Streptomyces sp. BE303]MED7953905.1 membrane protein insertion efficiency factor YidD [Streptomyces sp. BE303]
MAYRQPHQGDPYPTTQRPGRAWWWLPAEERRRRRRQRKEWKAYLRKHGEKKKDNDCLDNLDCSGGCDGPCLLLFFPVMTVAGIRFALAGGRGRRPGGAAGRVDPAAPVPGGFAAGVLYGAVRYYRTEISPGRPACCPYTPTCSTYAVQALHRHGAVRGARLTVGRLLSCHPGVARRGGGVDPVPER